MDEENRPVGVTLTADNAQYDAAMAASAKETQGLSGTVDTLIDKIDRLSKSAGRKLEIGGGASMAVITGMTYTYGRLEQQMSGLQGQSQALSDSWSAGKDTADAYERSVSKIRDTFPTTSDGAIQLVTSITRLTNQRGEVDRLANSFSKMGQATGENPAQLASGVLQLSRQMGNGIRDVERYNNAIVKLSANSNTNATSLVGFASSLAPAARQIKQSQTDVLGVSAAFARAGQDGNVAATAYSRMVTDISRATETGSPELAKYANLLGVTVDQFKGMDKTTAVVQIFDELNRMGPSAISVLNRMGLDGQRTLKAISAVSQQSGGLGSSIGQARSAFNSGDELDRASKAAGGGLFDQVASFRNSSAMLSESVGSTFAPIAEQFFKGAKTITDGANLIVNSPLGKVGQLIAGALAPVGLAGGFLLTQAGRLGTAAAIAGVVRGSGSQGLRDARRGIRLGQYDPETRRYDMRSGDLQDATATGRSIALGGGNFFSRAQYMMGQTLGGFMPAYEPGRGLLNRAGGLTMAGAGAGMRLFGESLGPIKYGAVDDATKRPTLTKFQTLGDLLRGRQIDVNADPTQGGMRGRARDMLFRTMSSEQQASFMGLEHGDYQEYKKRIKAGEDPSKAFDASSENSRKKMDAFAKATSMGETAAKKLGTEHMNLAAGGRSLVAGFGKMQLSLASATAGLGKMAAQATLSAGKAAASGVGGMLMSNPIGLALTAGMLGYELYDKTRDKTKAPEYEFDSSNPYVDKYGGKTKASSLPIAQTPDQVLGTIGSKTRKDLTSLTDDQAALALSDQYSLNDPKLKMFRGNEEGIAAYLGAKNQASTPSQEGLAATQVDVAKITGGDTQATNRIMRQVLATMKQGSSQPDYAAMLDSLGTAKTQEARGRIINEAVNSAELYTRAQNFTSVADSRRFGGQQLDAVSQALEDSGYAQKGDGLFGSGKSNEDLFDTSRDKSLPDADIGKAGRRLARLRREMKRRGVKMSDLDEDNQDTRAIASALGWNSYRQYEEGYTASDYLQKELAKAQKGADAQERANKLADSSGGVGEDAKNDAMRKRIGKDGQTLFDVFSYAPKNTSVGKALSPQGTEEDVAVQTQAALDLFRSLQAQGKSYADISRMTDQISSAYSDEKGQPQVIQATQLRQIANRQFQMFDAPQMSIGQRADTALDIYRGSQAEIDRKQAKGIALSPEELQRNLEYQQQATEAVQTQLDTYKQLAIQAREYAISVKESDYSFGLQRSRAQEDFARQRQRAEEDYNRQRARAEADFQLQQRQGREDFNLSRLRQEQDFNHSVVNMAKQAAQSMYDIYSRVDVARTVSSQNLLTNGADQLKRMRQQEKDLETLRGRGLSNNAIQQLGLTDAKNAQQASRLVEETGEDPRLVQQFNKQVKARIKAGKNLVTDDSSMEWQEMLRSYKLARGRAEDDFEKQMRRSRDLFRRQLDRQREDFGRSIDYQAEDFNRQMDRMQTDYAHQKEVAKDAMSRQTKDILGDLDDILDRSTGAMDKTSRKQIKKIVSTYRELAQEGGRSIKGLRDIIDEAFGSTKASQKKDKQIDTLIKNLPKGSGLGSGGPVAASGAFTMGTPADHEDGEGGEGHTHGPGCGHAEGGPIGMMSAMGGSGQGGPKGIETQKPLKSYTLTAYFGQRGSMWSSGYHTGQDFANSTGTPFYAVADGTVTSTAYKSWGGNVIRINHGGGHWTDYAHGNTVLVSAGQKVKRGEQIGTVGAKGNVTGPHLHLEYRKNGVLGNPLSFIGNAPANFMGKTGKNMATGPGDVPEQIKFPKTYTKLEDAADKLRGTAFALKKHQASDYLNENAKRWVEKNHPGAMIDFSGKGGKPGVTSWYSRGAIFGQATDIGGGAGAGENGRELLMPLNERGAEFLSMLMMRMMPVDNARGSTPVINNHYSRTTIDKSTTFTGQIVVQANDTGAFLEQLSAMQRQQALTNPTLAGAR